MFETLEIAREGKVATIWMNRPDVHNAFNETLIAELSRAFVELQDDAGVRVIVLAGRGKSFSAGADLNWMRRAAGYSFEQNLADAQALAGMLHRIAACPKPTVARVHGAALGGGTGLTAACDIAIAADTASFATTEVKFGIIPATIGPFVVQAIGARQAHRFFLTAERFDAATAARIGLVHDVCSADQLDAAVATTVENLLVGGPNAQAEAKQLITRLDGAAITPELGQLTAEWIARLRGEPEARDGIGAFLEKRKPGWLEG